LNPQFTGSVTHDYSLLSSSPCIDSGDPDPAYNDPDGTRNDVGAFPYAQPGFSCGESNGDGDINVGDAVFLINYIFRGGPAPEPVCVGDANGDDEVNVGDAVFLINYIFKEGPAPVGDCCP
jgi:hypothetical protein